jgi:hypothetical protein
MEENTTESREEGGALQIEKAINNSRSENFFNNPLDPHTVTHDQCH